MAKTPRNQQIADDLRRLIHTGVYAAGAALPDQMELATRYEVARETIRKALAQLANEELIEMVQGHPARVRERIGVNLTVDTDAITWAERVGDRGEDRVVHAVREGAEGLVALRLRIEVGEQVVRRVRHQTQDGVLVVIHMQWVPAELADRVAEATGYRLDEAPQDDPGDVFAMFQEAGRPGSTTTETHVARAATQEEVRTFALPPTVPILITTRVTVDGEGVPVEYSHMPSRGDMTVLSASYPVDPR